MSIKQISPVEVTRRMLEKIEAENEKVNVYITVTAEEALDQAALAEKEIAAGNSRGPLHGVPVALKDMIYIRGIRTTRHPAKIAGGSSSGSGAAVAIRKRMRRCGKTSIISMRAK